MTGSRSARRWVVRVALILFAILGALLAAEWGYRLVFAGSKGLTTRPGVVEADPILGWRHGAGVSAQHRHLGPGGEVEFDVLVRTDAAGHRTSDQAEAARATESGARPVVFLGDSLTFGWGVAEEETFVARVRNELGVPVRNFGVSGFGTGQECLLLEREVLALQPAAVVLTFCPNDVAEAASAFRYGRTKPLFGWDGQQLVDPELPVGSSWLEQVSGVYRRCRDALAPPIEVDWTPEERDLARGRVRALHRRMAAACAAAGARFLLLSAAGDRWLEPAEGVEWIDLEVALRQAAEAASVVFPSDAHWTAAGHAAVATQVLARLR